VRGERGRQKGHGKGENRVCARNRGERRRGHLKLDTKGGRFLQEKGL